MTFEHVQEFLKEHEEDHDHYQYHRWQKQFDDKQLTSLQSNAHIDHIKMMIWSMMMMMMMNQLGMSYDDLQYYWKSGLLDLLSWQLIYSACKALSSATCK